MQNPQNLIWIDLEMTGLDPDQDVIIEMATIVTDSDLNTLAEGPVIAIHHSDAVLARMDEWNTRTHGASGLTQRVKDSTVSMAEAEAQTIAFLEQWVPQRQIPDLWQQHLPGSPVPLSPHAQPGKLLPLPQPRRLDPQGVGGTLGP
ncbi:UNVERIFIED_ORG: oligoribonuclease (3'-5' exoribonuclease) [Pseudomonas vranovensis]|nr:oligoribonuclease (3'-5' exoribonuclease) [Pseudomonas vranovensis]